MCSDDVIKVRTKSLNSQAFNEFDCQIDPAGGMGYDHFRTLTCQLVTQGQTVYTFRIHMELGLDAVFLQCIQQENGVLDRYGIIGLGMPNKSGRSVGRYEVLQRMVRFLGLVIVAQQILKGTMMGIFSGSDYTLKSAARSA